MIEDESMSASIEIDSSSKKSKQFGRIREGLVPFLPQNIKIAINAFKLSLPIKSSKEIFEYSYLDDILILKGEKMNLNIIFNKLDDLVTN